MKLVLLGCYLQGQKSLLQLELLEQLLQLVLLRVLHHHQGLLRVLQGHLSHHHLHHRLPREEQRCHPVVLPVRLQALARELVVALRPEREAPSIDQDQEQAPLRALALVQALALVEQSQILVLLNRQP